MKPLFYRMAFNAHSLENVVSKNIWVIIELYRKQGKNKTLQIPALIDTGCSLGLVLPHKHPEIKGLLMDEIKKYESTEEPTRVLRQGIPITDTHGKAREFPVYTVRFNILRDKSNKVQFESPQTIFYGENHAIIGMDFLINDDFLLLVDGMDMLFSLASEEPVVAEDPGSRNSWAERSMNRHRYFQVD